MELGPHGIRANAICPGPVAGPRMDRVSAATEKNNALMISRLGTMIAQMLNT